MTNKHLLKVNTMPTVAEFKSSKWTDRKPYVGLVPDNKLGGGGYFTTMNP